MYINVSPSLAHWSGTCYPSANLAHSHSFSYSLPLLISTSHDVFQIASSRPFLPFVFLQKNTSTDTSTRLWISGVDTYNDPNSQSSSADSDNLKRAGVAHDFNNKFSIIQAYAELLKRGIDQLLAQSNLSDETQGIVQGMQEAVGVILRTNDSARNLAIHCMQSNRSPLPNSSLVVTDLLDSKKAKSILGDDVDIKSHFDPDVWSVMASAVQIDRIVDNLLQNAREAMDKAMRKHVVLRAENAAIAANSSLLAGQSAKPGNFVRLSVQDSGKGISPNDLPNIFTPHYSTKRSGQPSGLGLFVVKSIVEDMGGFVAVESKVGVGTSFDIYLPAQVTANDPSFTREVSSVSIVPPTLEEQICNTPILMIEDDIDLRKCIPKGLRIRGFRHVFTASTREEALSLLQQNPSIGLVIVDVRLGQENGIDLLNEIHNSNPQVTLCLWTGFFIDSNDPKLPHSQVTILEKPMSMDEFRTAIRDAIRASLPSPFAIPAAV